MLFKLTDTAIRAAKPREKRYKPGDGEGLYVELAPTGGKWWRIKFCFRFGGREKRLGEQQWLGSSKGVCRGGNGVAKKG